MKPAVVRRVGMGMGIALVCVIAPSGRTVMAETKKPAKEQPAAAPQPAKTEQAPGEKVIFTFDNDEKMHDFTALWQQRQGIILRMTVLQSYWNEEQATLGQLNTKFATDYKLDVAKNYVLDDKRRVLIEKETPAATQSPEASKSAAPAPQGPKP